MSSPIIFETLLKVLKSKLFVIVVSSLIMTHNGQVYARALFFVRALGQPYSLASFGLRVGFERATKAAAVALGETLDAELRPRGVSTSVICPQFFRSGLADSLSGEDARADEMARKLLSRTRLTSEIIARRSVRGIEARRVVITPDALATFFWYSKRFTRVPFLGSTRLIGRVVARGR